MHLVNRQSGSGTRVWLDAQFKTLGISPQSVPGYEREEPTHLAVARAVDQGEATVGLGIHAAASAYGLDFVPLTIEYFFNERSHAGVILSPQIEKGELVRRTLNLLRSLSAEKIAGTVRHLTDYQ